MRYRLYTPADFEALYAIEELCFKPPFRFGRRTMQHLVAAPNSATWIAEESSRMAGFALVEWRQEIRELVAYIRTIEVAPGWRGRGVGKELLQRIERSARNAGARTIWLHVDEQNSVAKRLYETTGFAPEGRSKDYYAPNRSALTYCKALDTKPLA